MVNKRIILKNEKDYVDDQLIMDYSYPANQPVTEVGTYPYEVKDYAHVPFSLGFSPLGHKYTTVFQYQDVETGVINEAKATATAFQISELLVDGVIVSGTIGAFIYFFVMGK